MTSPSRTSKSTSVSACTEPKDLVMPRASSVGAPVASGAAGCSITVTRPSVRVPGSPGAAEAGLPGGAGAPPGHRRGLAVLGELAAADVGLLEELVREQDVVVLLRHPQRLDQHRGDVPLAVRDLAVDAGGRLALDERDRELRGRV